MAHCIAKGVRAAGAHVEVLQVRDYTIVPCQGCMACMRHPRHTCVLAGQDDAQTLLAALHAAPLLIITAPIYFYHLPASFKALIDRGQAAWVARHTTQGQAQGQARQAVVALVAGRPRGAKLFEGSLLTLRYFLEPFDFAIAKDHCLAGYDGPSALQSDSAACEGLYTLGVQCAARVHP